MPTLKIIKSFSFAERGVEVIDYTADETVDVSDDCAEVALAEKWAEEVTEKASRRGKKSVEAEPVVDDEFERETAARSK